MTETRPEGRRGPPQRREGRTTLRRAGSYPHLRGFTPRFVGFTIEHMFIMVGPRSGVALKTGGTPATVGSRGVSGPGATGQSHPERANVTTIVRVSNVLCATTAYEDNERMPRSGSAPTASATELPIGTR